MTNIRKYSIALIIAAAVIIEVMGAVQYFMATYGVKRELLAKAERDMEESQRVAIVKTEVETALKNAEQSIRGSLVNPDTIYRIGASIIKLNPHVVGVGVAFVPGYYKDKASKELYLPYTYDDQESLTTKGKRTGKPHIKTNIPNFDYTTREWYRSAMAGQRQWCNPYLGEGGINVLMCTYSIPIMDADGHLAAVFFADVTMEDATVLMNGMSSSIRMSGIIILCIQVVSMLLMAFIIWRAVSASRRYKERYVDPEKDLLIEQLSKLREVNARLIKRNQDLAQKNVELQSRLDALQK